MVTLTICDITKADMLPWVWQRLYRAIKTNTASITPSKRFKRGITDSPPTKKSTSDSLNKSKLSKLYGILQSGPKMKYANLRDLE
ncbi:hypothetical protein FSP39_010313 [Pinctada imbricata]|uniref:Uncharacterized protein n=1 Tax=Pinctada imbricata TaxID=66713 RepID=A0AA88YUP7_PINIB|nr:hypothetical protein FSP39_010313 [Pinctada imbricata]